MYLTKARSFVCSKCNIQKFGKCLQDICIKCRIHIPIKKGEVQKHGLKWEDNIRRNVFQMTQDEIESISYTHNYDVPSKYNKLEPVNISIKTSGTKTQVCMANCLTLFNTVSTRDPFHLLVIFYNQDDELQEKCLEEIVEIDLTHSQKLLFGELTKDEIESLDKLVKSVPQKESPTKEQHDNLYEMRNSLQKKSGAIHLDIKCNSQQSRLQCSFNKFQKFLENNSHLVIHKSQNGMFRGGKVIEKIDSKRRCFNKK